MGFYFLVHCYRRNCVVSLVGSMGWSVTSSPMGSSTPLELLVFPTESNSTRLHWKPQNTNSAHTQVCIHTHIDFTHCTDSALTHTHKTTASTIQYTKLHYNGLTHHVAVQKEDSRSVPAVVLTEECGTEHPWLQVAHFGYHRLAAILQCYSQSYRRP